SGGWPDSTSTPRSTSDRPTVVARMSPAPLVPIPAGETIPQMLSSNGYSAADNTNRRAAGASGGAITYSTPCPRRKPPTSNHLLSPEGGRLCGPIGHVLHGASWSSFVTNLPAGSTTFSALSTSDV